jgi:hypothetical protein
MRCTVTFTLVIPTQFHELRSHARRGACSHVLPRHSRVGGKITLYLLYPRRSPSRPYAPPPRACASSASSTRSPCFRDVPQTTPLPSSIPASPTVCQPRHRLAHLTPRAAILLLFSSSHSSPILHTRPSPSPCARFLSLERAIARPIRVITHACIRLCSQSNMRSLFQRFWRWLTVISRA